MRQSPASARCHRRRRLPLRPSAARRLPSLPPAAAACCCLALPAAPGGYSMSRGPTPVQCSAATAEAAREGQGRCGGGLAAHGAAASGIQQQCDGSPCWPALPPDMLARQRPACASALDAPAPCMPRRPACAGSCMRRVLHAPGPACPGALHAPGPALRGPWRCLRHPANSPLPAFPAAPRCRSASLPASPAHVVKVIPVAEGHMAAHVKVKALRRHLGAREATRTAGLKQGGGAQEWAASREGGTVRPRLGSRAGPLAAEDGPKNRAVEPAWAAISPSGPPTCSSSSQSAWPCCCRRVAAPRPVGPAPRTKIDTCRSRGVNPAVGSAAGATDGRELVLMGPTSSIAGLMPVSYPPGPF
jgi:hypothetical protein